MASTSRGTEGDDTCGEKTEEAKSSNACTSLKVQTSGEVRERKREGELSACLQCGSSLMERNPFLFQFNYKGVTFCV